MRNSRTVLYAAVGPTIVSYELDVDGCGLERQSELTLPLNVQYAWAHPCEQILYVGASSRKNADNPGTSHAAYALSIDGETGTLAMLGEPVALPDRPTHVSCDRLGQHLLAAFPKAGQVAVVRIHVDGSLGAILQQRPGIDAGHHTHQVRVTPDGQFCIAVARGNPADRGWWAYKSRQQEPGSINVFDYHDGVLGQQDTFTIDDGYDFGPRHLDFHPTAPWLYATLETQNEVVVFQRDSGGVSPVPLQRLSTLEDPDGPLVHHGLGTVHVHPRGHVVYVANRSHKAVPQRNGTKLILKAEQENSLVVYSVNAESGLLTQLQRIDSGGVCPRTFSLDPSGRMLVVANAESHWVKDGAVTQRQSANLATFRVSEDGRLELRQTYDVDASPGQVLTWAGVVQW